uniref:Uncharacterized protein n=1 Tax=viral metagenome TaxID=1070528 RepID=A0A6M3IIV2_9ZZZZ
MDEKFWEWLASQGGDVEGWKRYVHWYGHGQPVPEALKPYYEHWQQNVDTTPITIRPDIYKKAAIKIINQKLANKEIDRDKYESELVKIETEAKFPTIDSNAPYLTEAIPIGEALLYGARAIKHLDRQLELGKISGAEYKKGLQDVSGVVGSGVVDKTAPFYDESQNLMSEPTYKVYKKEWETYQKDLKTYEGNVAKEAYKTETARLAGQQVVAEAEAKVRQMELNTEFATEQERLIGAEFADTGQTGLDRDSPLDWRGKPLRPVTATAEAGNIASVRAMEAAQSGSIPIEQVPGQAGDRLRQAIAQAEALGIDVSGVVGTQIGIKQMTTEIGEQMIGQRIIALINAITQRMASEEEQESRLLAKELPGGFKRFEKFRGEFIGGGTALESGDAGRTGFEGFTRFVEDDPELKEKLTEMRAQRLSRFPVLTRAFQRAPFEERKKGFSKFITSTPELRSQLEKRTRPSRTRQTSFRPFKGR